MMITFYIPSSVKFRHFLSTHTHPFFKSLKGPSGKARSVWECYLCKDLYAVTATCLKKILLTNFLNRPLQLVPFSDRFFFRTDFTRPEGHFKKMRDNKKIFFISLLPSDQSDVLSYLTSLDNIKDDKEEFESCFFFFIYTDPLRLIDRSYFLLPIPNH